MNSQIEELRDATRSLLALLEEPEPGLSMWHTLVGEAWARVLRAAIGWGLSR